MDLCSPSLPETKSQVFQDQWASTQIRTPLPNPPKPDIHRNLSTSDDDSMAAFSAYPWTRDSNRRPSTNPHPSPSPYETPLYTPPPPKSSPPTQDSTAPPTPPESLSNSSSSSSSSSCPPVPTTTRQQPQSSGATNTALPGTMSSRSRENSRLRTKSSPRSRSSASKHGQSDSDNFGKRFKSAVKEMFKRNPIDESQFERIEDRHWTEEY
ncbi:hypothetical protein B0A50_06763 [Salinomyces thailandicus]|uniref:Uncharacterized protein n=1 Tax=Salinomyces thailandicus TaxID=706561 RepID=A0A4U0TQF1_9PEZI|nr:hypothetical protein B0A50_06763 [Salinomyces thailandica]